MACLVETFDITHGPITTVLVGIPDEKPLRYEALLDSGAQFSHVSKTVADDLGLVATGAVTLHGVGGSSPSNTYVLNIAFEIQGSEVNFRHIRASSFVAAPARRYEVIIGRDILCKGHFSMSFDGRFLFCL